MFNKLVGTIAEVNERQNDIKEKIAELATEVADLTTSVRELERETVELREIVNRVSCYLFFALSHRLPFSNRCFHPLRNLLVRQKDQKETPKSEDRSALFRNEPVASEWLERILERVRDIAR